MIRHSPALVVLLLALAAAGCGSREPGSSGSGSTPRAERPLVNVKAETGAQALDRFRNGGAAATLYGQYRVGVALNASIARPDTEIDVFVAVTRAGSDEPVPDVMTINLWLDSESLPMRELKIRAAEDSDANGLRVARGRKDLISVSIKNTYGVGSGDPAYYFPLAKHTIRVRIGLDGKEAVSLPDLLTFEVGRWAH